MAPILDVSNNNAITEHSFLASGSPALICKATEGTTFQDATLGEHRRIAKRANKPFGSYLFLHPNSTGSEAEYYLAYAKPIRGDIQPIIDAEVTNMGADALGHRIVTCSEALKKAGYKPILYIGPYLWRQIVKVYPEIKTLPIWEAQYPTKIPPVFTAWFNRLRIRLIGGRVVMWQYTDHYRVGLKFYDASHLYVKMESLLIP